MLTLHTTITAQISYSRDWMGNTVAKDKYGNTIATGSKDWQGNFVWKDEYGNVIQTESKTGKGTQKSEISMAT
ncbi:MAG: hypothetical protein HWD63_02205 [Candidatus Parvibacillus calidus]|nr:MAG: hypothetical protein HWD63_02205 [Candidatus Parvibacillus calidus]